MEAYLYCEKPVLCYNKKCMVSGSRYLKKIWINKNGRKIGGFYECQVCGAIHIHIQTYRSKTMNEEVTPLNPNDEKQFVREYMLKKYYMKENKRLEKRNREEIRLDKIYQKELKEDVTKQYSCTDKEGFWIPFSNLENEK